MKTIDLEKIFDNNIDIDCDFSYTKESINRCMSEAIRQALILAAENATTKDIIVFHHTFDGNIQEIDKIVDKDSIINTFNKIV